MLHKVGLLRDCPGTPLAGRMTALLDLCSRLPRQLWDEADAAAHGQRHWPQVVAALPKGALVVFDLGDTNFGMFLPLTLAQVTFVTRAKSNLVYQIARVLRRTTPVHELIVWFGSGDTRQQRRLIEVLWHGTWYRYLTNELDPTILPPEYAVALYWQRWRIEDAVNLVKRLLGLANFGVGSANGVGLQLWATWPLDAVLVDLTDAVADARNQPFAALSLEMIYRSLYFFTGAYQRGEASDPIADLAAKADRFGSIKRQRKTTSKFKELTLTLAPDP